MQAKLTSLTNEKHLKSAAQIAKEFKKEKREFTDRHRLAILFEHLKRKAK